MNCSKTRSRISGTVYRPVVDVTQISSRLNVWLSCRWVGSQEQAPANDSRLSFLPLSSAVFHSSSLNPELSCICICNVLAQYEQAVSRFHCKRNPCFPYILMHPLIQVLSLTSLFIRLKSNLDCMGCIMFIHYLYFSIGCAGWNMAVQPGGLRGKGPTSSVDVKCSF